MASIYRELAKKIQNEVSIKEVIMDRIPHGRYGCLCPFHEDKTTGSFHYSEKKNIFKCFSCNEGGGPVKFIEKFDKVSHKEAVLRLSLEYGFIDKGMYDSLSKSNDYEVKETKSANRSLHDSLKKNPDMQLHIVYKLLERNLPLTNQDREYLYSRNINDEDILRNHYFSFNGEDVTDRIIADLKTADFDESILLGVPGFYKNEDKIKMVSVKGIGIPLKNAQNQIIAIQIRNTEPTGSRYYYFSSTEENNGTSCGSVIDVVSKGFISSSTLYITEGHFKADKLAKETESFVLSLQGVNNISPLPKVMTDLSKYEITDICIALDSDIYTNPQVFKAAENLCNELNEIVPSLPVSFLTWEPEYGKGIDDV
ncbi:MAG: CHC2 zinc finger domain-containing protein, partial [Erysipelotrichaceae bacterium]|nr:CHC2 zinc finger domain-containing protein [Erysipelotrichaceae bacterium]